MTREEVCKKFGIVTIQSPENLYICTKENFRHPTESTQIKKVKNGL